MLLLVPVKHKLIVTNYMYLKNFNNFIYPTKILKYGKKAGSLDNSLPYIGFS